MSAQDDAHFGITHLTEAECWEAIRGAEVGRIAVVVDGRPEIFPINHVVDEGTVVFRSGEGTKFDGALNAAPVAFEVDGRDPETNVAWSAVVKGTVEAPGSIAEVIATLELPISPWQAGLKSRYLRIVPSQTSGRRFSVQRGGPSAG